MTELLSGLSELVRVEALTRVEGEGGLLLRVEDGRVVDVELRIFEPPRMFEAFLRGRAGVEAPDITARICGICPVAYQMSACAAIEAACGVVVDGPWRDLRLLLYCAEWIESHALHVYLLHAPDFLGYEHGLAMAADHPSEVTRGLRLKKAGNDLMTVLGGRPIHPVNVRVGGWYRVPTRPEVLALVPMLEQARDDALATVSWVAGFDMPDVHSAYPFVCVSHPDEYPMLGDRVRASDGLDIAVAAWPEHFTELHLPRSTALHATYDGRTYLTGPLARYSLASGHLRPIAQEAAADAGLGGECRNPFRSIVVRAVEIVHACDLALALIDAYEPPDRPAVAVPPQAGVGHGVSEAPRGLLYHRYTLDGSGTILDATIVPPTSQNQAAIEDDVRAAATALLGASHDELQHRCEHAVRNHDPCISCATHALRVEIVGT